jgi:hypothetical protein
MGGAPVNGTLFVAYSAKKKSTLLALLLTGKLFTKIAAEVIKNLPGWLNVSVT